MNKQELIDTVGASTEASDALIDAVAGEATVQVIGLGSFSSGERAPRVARSPDNRQSNPSSCEDGQQGIHAGGV